MMEQIKVNVRDVLTLVSLVLTLATSYFATRSEIKEGQLRTEMLAQDIQSRMEAERRITELRMARLELDIKELKRQIEK